MLGLAGCGSDGAGGAPGTDVPIASSSDAGEQLVAGFEALQFPREMCVFFGYTLEDGDTTCVNGEFSTAGTSRG